MGWRGPGCPVLFIHGWALGQHAYKRALKRLVHLGCRVYAPAMPGFGGSSALPGEEFSIAGYAQRMEAFLEAVGVDEPVFVIGHSFGGAVATKLAHDFPDRVGYLVLINAVGGGAWLQAGNKVRSMAERPLWDWAFFFPWDALMGRGLVSTMRAILEDLVPNLVRDPLVLWRVAMLARTADLTGELADLRALRLRCWCCGAKATPSSPRPASKRCAPPWGRRAPWYRAGTRGCWPTPTASAR